ncbi:MAG TPA: class I SAM-dependent methyltransferase [Dehalococcoidales bacterium]|nr:class I SAM-dependent methyltransferase [Dehalococcoidales bacterium]
MAEKKGSNTPNHDVKHFNHWASTYEQSFMQQLYFGVVHKKMLEVLANVGVKEPKYILDVGCGTGRFLRNIANKWPEAQLFGVDPAELMISEATRLNPRATFQVGFAESLPMADQYADIIVSSLSFHHWVDQKKGIQEIARVLKPGGLFCLADHNFQLFNIFGENVKSRKEVRALMFNAGMVVQSQHGLGVRFVLITLAQKNLGFK